MSLSKISMFVFGNEVLVFYASVISICLNTYVMCLVQGTANFYRGLSLYKFPLVGNVVFCRAMYRTQLCLQFSLKGCDCICTRAIRRDLVLNC